MDSDEIRNKCNSIWNTIVQLETDKYDYEQRQLDQDYEFKELAEKQKLQLRNKAIKKGLDPESFTGAHPPTIHMFSKYERRTDTRTYGDRKKLYEGGAEVIRAEALEAAWKEKFAEWSKRPKAKLPKWFGVRPGKKEGDPETPEGEEEAEAEDAAEEEYDEEEEEEEKETQRHLKAKKKLKLKMPPRKNMMKRRKRKRRRKKNKLLLQSISRLKSKPLTSYIPKTSHCFYTNEWLLCSTRYNLFCIEL